MSLFHRAHYNKIAALLGRADIGDSTKVKLVEEFSDMFEADNPKKPGDDTYFFRREKFYQAVARHHNDNFGEADL